MSQPERPDWIDRPQERDSATHRSFVGFSNRYSSEVEAREDAKINGWAGIVQQIGLYAEQRILQATSTTGLTSEILSPAVVRDACVSSSAESFLISSPIETYTEHYQGPGGTYGDMWYKSYVLFHVNRDFLIRAQMDAIEILRRGQTSGTQASLDRAKELLRTMK